MAPAAAAQAKAKPRAALNPSFQWDGGADAPAPAVQAAWDFKGAPLRAHFPRHCAASRRRGHPNAAAIARALPAVAAQMPRRKWSGSTERRALRL